MTKPDFTMPALPAPATMSDEARELHVYADTSSEPVYRARLAAQAAIRRHINRGNFDAQKMVKAYRNVMDFAAQEYTREYGARGKNGSYGCFSPADRQQAAEMMAAADAAEYNCNRWE